MDESISLRELVDDDIVQAIQDRFAKTVGVSSVIFLPDGDALTRFSNPTKFCSLIRSTKEGRRRCFQSFTEMSRKALKLSEPEIMYCFAHGAHFVAPIIVDGERKATMYAGQFRPEKFSPEQLEELKQIAVEIDLDPESLVEEAENMRTVKDKVVMNCLRSFFQTVKVIAELGAQAFELRQTKDALQNAHDDLEMRVQERTAELTKTNEELRREIAERKAAEDALRKSERSYRDLFDNMMDGVVVHRMIMDEGGRPVDYVLEKINNAAERILSWKSADMEGKRATEVYDGETPFIKRYARVARTGESEYSVEYYPWFKMWYEITSFCPMPGYFANVFRDITERKSTEDALRKSEEKLRNIVEQSVDGIVLVDEEGTLIEWNRGQERITGLSRAEVLGRPLWDVMFQVAANEHDDPALCDRIKAGVLKILETGQAEWLDRLEERVVRRPDGVCRVLQVAVFPIKTGKGFMTGAISRDVTKRKQAEEQIKRSLREKDVLMREMHHRVKNNLRVVSSLLSMQARTTQSKEAIDVLSKSQSRMNTMALIHTQLYESGDLSELNMKEFVGTLSEELFRSYQVSDTKIARIVDVTDRKFPASVGIHVGLIINELLSNALRHAFGEGGEGKIEVSLTASEDGRVNLTVSDDGVGLPPGFDINESKTLGLRLVKILAEDQLQGTLEVTSDGGATFKMEFDLKDNGGSLYGEDKNTDR
ncbi:MAG: PocR ligand-binding domain-containing protein [Euryarchaeota archaeon]|nr:PocR ligand-binding domain-containing protein [Euryarchaeota archaeon]